MPKYGTAPWLLITGGSSVGALLSLTTCTLQTLPPRVSLVLRGPNVAASAARGRGVTDHQCFAAFVTNEGANVTATELGTRQPSCFGATGKYVGAFSSADMVAGQAQISLALGQHRISLLALDKTADCLKRPLDYFFPNSDSGVADAYAVGNSGDVDVSARTTVISISSTLYDPPTNLTPGCPRATQECAGALFCDNFTDPDGTSLGLHYPDVGSRWMQQGNPYHPVIVGNRADLSAGVGSDFYFVNFIGRSDASITARVALGNYGLGASDVQMLGRYAGSSDYSAARITRTGSLCTPDIHEYVAGVFSSRVTGSTFPCDPTTFYDLRFVLNGTSLLFSVNGTPIQTNAGSPALGGKTIGFLSQGSATPNSPFLVDSISVRTVP